MQYLRNFNNIVMSTRLRAMYHDYQVQEVGRPFTYITLVFLEQIPDLCLCLELYIVDFRGGNMTAMSFPSPMYSESILFWSLRLLLFHTTPCRSHSESRAFRPVHPTP